jgi:hypothetical protein
LVVEGEVQVILPELVTLQNLVVVAGVDGFSRVLGQQALQGKGTLGAMQVLRRHMVVVVVVQVVLGQMLIAALADTAV